MKTESWYQSEFLLTSLRRTHSFLNRHGYNMRAFDNGVHQGISDLGRFASTGTIPNSVKESPQIDWIALPPDYGTKDPEHGTPAKVPLL